MPQSAIIGVEWQDAMSQLRAVDAEDIIARAGEALSKDSGGTVVLVDVEVLSNDHRRNFIARAAARYTNGSARSVIVKATRSPSYDPMDENVLQASGLAKEWVACAFLAARAPSRGHGSALLAGDVAGGIMVFEDLGAHLTSLVDPLLKGTAQEAERALELYATALGRLHADTIGCLDAHHETLQSVFGSGRPRRPPGWPVEKDAELVAHRLGGTQPASELELLSSRLSDPGPWLTLIHGDPCPDNALLVDQRIRLIDYEFARPSHALLDGIYWRMGFPTCWCAGRTPADVAARVDAVYRAELSTAIPQAHEDTAYRVELTYMAAVWLFTSLSWRLDQALERDERWGIWSIRGRLLWYLEAVIEMTDAARVLPGINKVAQDWLAELRRRWPDVDPLGLYPGFASKPQ
jgi:phosphotransferase family enzyme